MIIHVSYNIYGAGVLCSLSELTNFAFSNMEEEKKDTDNIYVYSEETDKLYSENQGESAFDTPLEYEPDTSAPNYAQYPEEASKDQVADGRREDYPGKGGISVFGLLLKTMFNPVEGWKAVRRANISPETFQKECFYPLLAVYAVSKFAILAYSVKANLSEVLVDAVTSFVSFFFGYFCIVILLQHLMPKESAKTFDTDFGKDLVLLSLSSLCLFFIFTELLPMLWAVLIFLPLWTVYMICRSTKFIKIPEDRQLLTVALMNLIIIGVPILLEWGLGEILPK